MVYLVTGRRRDDGWPFAGEVMARSGQDAAAMVRGWGIEPEFVQDLGSGAVEYRVVDDGDDADEDADEDDGPPRVGGGPAGPGSSAASGWSAASAASAVPESVVSRASAGGSDPSAGDRSSGMIGWGPRPGGRTASTMATIPSAGR